jgi:hypothetical protein
VYKKGGTRIYIPIITLISCITFVLIECGDKSGFLLLGEDPVGVVLRGLFRRDLDYRVLFDPSLEEVVVLKYGHVGFDLLSRGLHGRFVPLIVVILVTVLLGSTTVGFGSLVTLPLVHCIDFIFVFFVELLLGFDQLLLESHLSLLFL